MVRQYSKLEDCLFNTEVKAQREVVKAQREAGFLPSPETNQTPPNLVDATWRDTYYQSIGIMNNGERLRMCQEYVCGWCWILLYYTSNTYRSVPDSPMRKVHRKEVSCQWNWFYPYHYAPFAHDIADFLLSADQETIQGITAYQGYSSRPFKPLTQLLAVLPPDSAHMLPKEYQSLLRHDSPISDFYPEHYMLDTNGKAQVLALPRENSSFHGVGTYYPEPTKSF